LPGQADYLTPLAAADPPPRFFRLALRSRHKSEVLQELVNPVGRGHSLKLMVVSIPSEGTSGWTRQSDTAVWAGSAYRRGGVTGGPAQPAAGADEVHLPPRLILWLA